MRKPLRRDKKGFIFCKALDAFPNWKPRRFTRADLQELEDFEKKDALEEELLAQQKRLKKLQRKARQLLA